MMKAIGERYEIVKSLGAGAMGEVFLVYDRRRREEVCLKLLAKVGPSEIARMGREFQTLTQLSHPNLIRVFDFGIDRGSGAFFTMEYASGGDLAKAGRLVPAKFYEAAWAILQALEYIHAHGLIHGDLKPSNILIDSQGNYRLADFGLCSVFGRASAERLSGTVAFISPEALRKNAPTPSSDIYSLGLLFYEMIFGRPLFEGTAGEIIGMKLASRFSLPQIPAEYGGAKMRSIVLRMLEPAPLKRYRSAAAIADEMMALGVTHLEAKGAAQMPMLRGAFAGRRAELEWLEKCLGQTDGGKVVSLYVVGQSGVGKSRLVDEFRVRSQIKGFKFFRAYCHQGDLRPLSPVTKLLNQVFPELDPQREKFSRFGPDLKRLLPELYPEVAAGSWEPHEPLIRSGRQRLFDNLLRYIAELSSNRKFVMAFEDIQWADSDTLDFLRLVSSTKATVSGRGVLMVSTVQLSPEGAVPDFIVRDKERFRTLNPADRELWDEFMRGLLGDIGSLSAFSEKLLKETGGNFLFATEIVRELVSDGLLVRRRGEWRVDPDWATKIKVPDGVRAVVQRRLGRLNPGLKKLTGMAAVLGRPFHQTELLELAGFDAHREHHIEELMRLGIFTRLVFGDRHRVDFAHGQLRRVAYDMVPQPVRRSFHKRVAEYFSERHAEAQFLGRHFAMAGDFEKACEFSLHSARQAERMYAYRQAADLYGVALRSVEKQPELGQDRRQLIAIYLGMGRAMNFLSPKDAASPLSKALALASSQPQDRLMLAESAIALGYNSVYLGRNEKAVKHFRQALSVANSTGHRKLAGEACMGIGFVSDKMGRINDAERSYLEALDHFAQAEYAEGSCRGLNYLGILRKRAGDLLGAEDFYRRALKISLEKNFLWSAMNLYGNLGNLYSSKGEARKALEQYTKSLQISKQISDRRIESVNLLNIGHSLNELGELDQAERKFLEALEKQTMLGDRGSEAITLNNLGFLYFRKGEFAKSLERYNKGWEIASQINEPRAQLANLIGLAENHTALADFEKAARLAETALSLARKTDDKEQMAAILSIMAEIKFEANDMEGAGESVSEYLNLSDIVGRPLHALKVLAIGRLSGVGAGGGAETIESRISAILNDNPLHRFVLTRLEAAHALRGGNVANPEIWVARLDSAIKDSRLCLTPSETWRLIALKIRYLELLGETFELSRERENLSRELAPSLAALDKQPAARLQTYLQIPHDETEDEVTSMGKANREQHLEVLFRVARTINSIRETDPLLNKIMDLALETLNGDRGFIMLYCDSKTGGEAPGRSLEAVVARNLDKQDILGETTISRSTAEEVAGTGKPLLLSRTDEDIKARQSVVDFKISSILCAPLAVKGRVLGIVYVDSRSGVTFDEEDLEFLASFADLAAIAIENARLTERLEKRNIYLQKQVESTWGLGSIVGRSSPMQRVFRMAESVAQTDVTVVISGESGTGKELLAKAIHFASSRKNARFVPVDCGAVAETLLESELFGFVKGAFTGATFDRAGLFEVAEGGTVFLDEIANTSVAFQAKLLRVLQEGEIRRVGDNKTRKIDVRVIAATNKDLEAEVQAGRFREDLFYRLNVVNINLPPLRQRREDVPILAGYFLEKVCKKMRIPLKSFAGEALDLLLLYPWPGNVRELENVCERAVIFSKGEVIGLESLPAEIRSARESGDAADAALAVPKTKAELKAEKAKLEKLFLVHILEKANGNVMQASRLARMDRSQIHHMMSKFGISSADFKTRPDK